MNELPTIRARSRAEIRPAHRYRAASYVRHGRRLRMRAAPFTWTSRLSGERSSRRSDRSGRRSFLKSKRSCQLRPSFFKVDGSLFGELISLFTLENSLLGQ